ncbi:MAG: hypothetical protein R2762_11385 [Bryobacteraceae bacterium]
MRYFINWQCLGELLWREALLCHWLGAHFHVLLYDAATGNPLAIIDANQLGQIRTGAASGVATA